MGVGNEQTRSHSYPELRDHFREHGQESVFRFWDRLSAPKREHLLEQAAKIDLATLARVQSAIRDQADPAPLKLEAVPVQCLPPRGGDPAAARRALQLGEAALAAGRIAVLTVAGGQATRLNFAGPKGLFPLGPVTGRTLFEQQAQKLRGLRRRYQRPLPWFIMTSEATDSEARKVFAQHDFFGLPDEDVTFFRQTMVPSLDFDGHLILEQPDRIFENPDGHGGSLTALLASSALANIESRGVDSVFYCQIDNPLVRMADAAFLGFHLAAGAEMSCKVIRKQDPMEKVGVVARVNGQVGIVEYTELDDEHRFARDANQDLEYWAGNTAIHVIATSFIRRVAEDAERLLPYHASEKKIPTLDDAGTPVQPEQPNGRKFERFVFDALGAASEVCVVEAERSLEYSPVKNADGVDSPTTARRDLVAMYESWLEAADIALPGGGAAIEIDHSRVDGPEEAHALGIRCYTEAADVIRVGAGVDT